MVRGDKMGVEFNSTITSEDDDLFVLICTATSMIGDYDNVYFYKKDLSRTSKLCMETVKNELLEKFPELTDKFSDKKASFLVPLSVRVLSLEHCLNEVIKNAIDSSAMRSQKTGNKTFRLDLKVKIKREKARVGNRYIIKVSDNGLGFKNLTPSVTKEYTEIFDTSIYSKWLYFLCCCGMCYYDPLNPSTKANREDLLGGCGLGLSHVNLSCRSSGGNLFFKNRKEDRGAQVTMTFMGNKLPTLQNNNETSTEKTSLIP